MEAAALSSQGARSPAAAIAPAGGAEDRLQRLVDLPRGRRARLVALAVDAGLAHRLEALGLQPGRVVQVLRRAPWYGPIHLQVGMTELMLRRRDACRIQVRPEEPLHQELPQACGQPEPPRSKDHAA